MIKKEYPRVHYYDQDFVAIYNHSWAWVSDCWHKAKPSSGIKHAFYSYKGSNELNFHENCLASFFLVYYSKAYPVNLMLDNFYNFQESSGAIRGLYDVSTGKPSVSEKNPEGLSPPLLAWAEYNLYHKVGIKIRIRNIMPSLIAYHDWIESNFKDKNGLYTVPLEVVAEANSPRSNMKYPVDFNAQMAVNALYMSALADVLNDKELGFRYKQQYFSLKTRINSLMWNKDDKIYYDLNAKEKHVKVKTTAAFWPLMAEIPNEDRAAGLFEHLSNPDSFGTENPFPNLGVKEKHFDENGAGACGAVIPADTYMIIKGLEKYGRYEFAREVAIRHLYFILDTFHPDGEQKGTVWKAYKPLKEGEAVWKKDPDWNRPLDMAYTGLSTIGLMIENIVGLYISLPKKTVDWFVPIMELMGIESLPLKRNRIIIMSNNTNRGWEISMESEKLYYFTIHLLEEGKKKTLPIPSGKCSMLLNRL